jgi:hypothetical protein
MITASNPGSPNDSISNENAKMLGVIAQSNADGVQQFQPKRVGFFENLCSCFRPTDGHNL